jgi:hypothetical protein
MVVRQRQRPKLPANYSEGYVIVPRTTPAVFDLDPRADVSKPAPTLAPEKVPA